MGEGFLKAPFVSLRSENHSKDLVAGHGHGPGLRFLLFLEGSTSLGPECEGESEKIPCVKVLQPVTLVSQEPRNHQGCGSEILNVKLSSL